MCSLQDYLRILRWSRPERTAIILIFLFTLADAVIEVIQPWPMKILLDHVFGSVPFGPPLQRIFQKIGEAKPLLLAIVITGNLALFALSSAVGAALNWIWTLTGRRTVWHLANAVFSRLQRRSLFFHSKNKVGELMTLVVADCQCAEQILRTFLFEPLFAMVTIIGMTILMLHLDRSMTLLALLLPPFSFIASSLLGRALRQTAHARRENEGQMRAFVQQTFAGINVVQAFAQEQRETHRYQKLYGRLWRAQLMAALIGSLNGLFSGLVTTLGAGIILWVGAHHVLDGRLSLGSGMLFVTYFGSMQKRVNVLSGIYPTMQSLSTNVTRIMHVLNTPLELSGPNISRLLPPLVGAVRLESVTTGYVPGDPTLVDISLDIQPGQIVGIAGASGVGKTTLVQLIPRFSDPWAGRVLVDGQNVQDVTLQSLRQQVALVLQEPCLFPVSISQNLSYGKPNATQSEIEAAARSANAHEFITALPQGYDTILGERGLSLSGGMRQRLSIARAILKDAPILILDEPTSALDAETEQLVLDALRRVMKGRTTFVIAHRLSTLHNADMIILLKDGRISDIGTHEQLVARSEYYVHLYGLQK